MTNNYDLTFEDFVKIEIGDPIEFSDLNQTHGLRVKWVGDETLMRYIFKDAYSKGTAWFFINHESEPLYLDGFSRVRDRRILSVKMYLKNQTLPFDPIDQIVEMIHQGKVGTLLEGFIKLRADGQYLDLAGLIFFRLADGTVKGWDFNENQIIPTQTKDVESLTFLLRPKDSI